MGNPFLHLKKSSPLDRTARELNSDMRASPSVVCISMLLSTLILFSFSSLVSHKEYCFDAYAYILRHVREKKKAYQAHHFTATIAKDEA